MIIRTALAAARCGIQMSLQTPSSVLIFPNAERQLQFKKKNLYTNAAIEKKSFLIHAVYPLCNFLVYFMLL